MYREGGEVRIRRQCRSRSCHRRRDPLRHRPSRIRHLQLGPEGVFTGHGHYSRVAADPVGAPRASDHANPLPEGRPSITVFVVVALVAFVRRPMVASLNAAKIASAYFDPGAIFVLGLVYMMVGQTDMRRVIGSSRKEG